LAISWARFSCNVAIMSKRDHLTIDILVFLVCIAIMIYFGGCASLSEFVNRERPPSRWEHSPEEYRNGAR
jgi:hypothetical protein